MADLSLAEAAAALLDAELLGPKAERCQRLLSEKRDDTLGDVLCELQVVGVDVGGALVMDLVTPLPHHGTDVRQQALGLGAAERMEDRLSAAKGVLMRAGADGLVPIGAQERIRRLATRVIQGVVRDPRISSVVWSDLSEVHPRCREEVGDLGLRQRGTGEVDDVLLNRTVEVGSDLRAVHATSVAIGRAGRSDSLPISMTFGPRHTRT